MASYRYDPFGRRYSKSVNGVTTVYDDDPEGRVIADYDGSGHVLRLYGYLGAATAPVVVMTPTGAMNGDNPVMSVVYDHFDRLGSVVATSANGALVGSFSYTPFGESPGDPELTGTEFGFAGYQYDAETGLYHTQNRYYDPRLGRFLSPDPLGQAAGRNVYAYVQDDPLDSVDPLGLCDNPQGCGGGSSGQLIASTATPNVIGPVQATPAAADLTAPVQFPESSSMGAPPQSSQQNGSLSNQQGSQLALNSPLTCSGPNSACAVGVGKGIISNTPGMFIDRENPSFLLCPNCFIKKFGKPTNEDYPP